MKTKTILIVLSVALTISLLVWYFISKKKTPIYQTGSADAPIIPFSAVSIPITTSNGFPIVYNTYSQQARQIQGALNVTQNGIIGPITLQEWRNYAPDVTERFKIDNAQQLANVLKTIYNGG